jgi:hypothetical protein
MRLVAKVSHSQAPSQSTDLERLKASDMKDYIQEKHGGPGQEGTRNKDKKKTATLYDVLEKFRLMSVTESNQ